jgi:hypothetical protein
MSLSSDHGRVLAATIEKYFQSFVGTSALEVARSLSIGHGLVMEMFEELCSQGYGTMNSNAELNQVSFDPTNPNAGFKFEPVRTHIFFPSKEALRKAFYASDLPQKRLPEYQTRLRLGAPLYGLAYFREEVLAKYFNHPEFYEVRDSLAGGEVQPASDAPEERWLDVRYGKCLLKSGHVAVSAVFKDLSHMSLSEQRHWHSHEIEEPELDTSDAHFKAFLRRTYEGDWAQFEDPIERLSSAISQVNAAAGKQAFFARDKNTYLQLPVEETYKSYCDSASELFKLIGPDNLLQAQLKALLTSRFDVREEEFVHAESGRVLSNVQLLARVETELGASGVVTKVVKQVQSLRVDADHKILEADIEAKGSSRQFAALCTATAEALEQLAAILDQKEQDSSGP